MRLERCSLLLPLAICLSLVIIPNSTGQQISAGICAYGSRKYTILGNSSFSPGDIFKFAQECANSYNGSLYELRNRTEDQALFKSLHSFGCVAKVSRTTNNAYFGPAGYIYVGPSVTSGLNDLPLGIRFTEDQVRKFWRRGDGTSMESADFYLGQPDNSIPGNEVCLHVYLGFNGGLWIVNDIACISPQMTALCVLDSPPAEKGCPNPPVDPTAGTSAPATVSIGPRVSATRPYYPFGTVANFTCPCGYNWVAPRTTIKPSSASDKSSTTTVQAECYGTIGWTTYSVTACESPAITSQISIQMGLAKVIFKPFLGNHSDAAGSCKQEGSTMTLPVITTAEDFQNLVRLLDLWPCIRGPEIPIAQNIMLKLTPANTAKGSAFVALWLTVFSNRSWWHPGEPAYNKSNLRGCAVMALRNGTWKLAAKNCFENSSTNSFICVNVGKAYAGNLTSCSKQNLQSGKSGDIILLSGGLRNTANDSVPLETIATQRCNCGQVYTNTENSQLLTTQSKCYGILGWIPSDITECTNVSESLGYDGNSYSLGRGSNSTFGIIEAAKVCHANTTGRGSIAELRSQSQADQLAFLMKVYCVPSAFLAPTAWKDMNASQQTAGRELKGVDVGVVWRLNDGSPLAKDLPFADGNPDNANGTQQCLQLRVNFSDPADGFTHGLYDSDCWNRSDMASHICSQPLENKLTRTMNVSDCLFPTNPTEAHEIPATLDYDPADIFVSGHQSSPKQLFHFGSVVNYTCPDGYSWAPVTSWPTDNAANTVSTKIRTKVSVRCFGTLGWTLYDVTKCVNATACGPLPPTPPNVNQTCKVTANGTAYECSQVCSRPPYAWMTGASSHTLSCNSSTNLWSTGSVDNCEVHCNASDIRNFAGVFRTWNGTRHLGSTVLYYCQGNDAFMGNASLAATRYLTKCEDQGTWSPPPPTDLACLPYRCNSRHIPTFQGVLQRRNTSAESLIGAKVTHYCQDSYSFWGNASAANEELETICQKNGTWSSVPANLACRIYKCNASAVPRAPPGAVESRNWTISLVGVSVSFSCPEGTAFGGNASTNNAQLQSTCQSNGSWTTLPFDKPCKPVVCDASQIKTFPGVLHTGNRTGEYLVGSNVTYSCQDSYSFWGNTSAGNDVLEMTCQKNGTWSSIPADLACKIYKCNASSAPSAPLGAVESRNWTTSLVGVSVYYSCPNGSAFDGNSSATNEQLHSTCQSNGTWTVLTSNKTCQPLICNASDINLFQGVTLSKAGVSIGSEATYSCPAYGTRLALARKDNGTRLVVTNGTYSVTCRDDLTWSQIPSDQFLVCSTFGLPCDPTELVNDNCAGQYVGMKAAIGTNRIGDSRRLRTFQENSLQKIRPAAPQSTA